MWKLIVAVASATVGLAKQAVSAVTEGAKKLAAPVVGSGLALAGSAHAALPAGAETAIASYQTDTVTVFGLLIAAGIAIFAVRKLGQKMGWL